MDDVELLKMGSILADTAEAAWLAFRTTKTVI